MAFMSETFSSTPSSLASNNKVASSGNADKDKVNGSENKEEGPPTVPAEELTSHFKCPICGRLYNDPVISIKCGHTFCRKCAYSCTHCPVDGEHCDTNQLVVNRLVVGQIDDQLIYCRYGLIKQDGLYIPDPSGCPEKIKLGSRQDHESQCQYAPVPCPNHSLNCGKFRTSELDQHLLNCPYHSCEHKLKGCEFVGTRDQVQEHLNSCGYRGLCKSVSLKDFHTQTKFLEEENRELKETVSLLTQRVELLEGNRAMLESQLRTCVSNQEILQKSYEGLQSLVEQLMTGRNRRSVGSPGNTTEGIRSRTSSSSSIASNRSIAISYTKRSPPVTMKGELWEMPFQFKCVGTLRGHKNVVWCLATHKRKLYSSGSDSLIKVWDLETLARGCVKTFEGHSGVVHTMAVYENTLLSAGDDLSIRTWDIETLTEQACLQNAHDNLITSMVVAGEFLFTASFSLIKVWDVKTLTLKHTIPGLHHWVRALVLNTDKDKLYSGSHNTIDIWDTTGTFNLKGKISHTFGSVYSLALTQEFIIGGTYNQNIQVFDLHTHRHVQTLMGHIGTVHKLVTSLSGRFLFSCSVDKSIQIWNLENMLPIQTLQRHEGSVNTIILFNDFIFSGSEDREIKVFQYFQMQMGFAVQG